MTISTINATYGAKLPQQTLTLTQNDDVPPNTPRKTVIFVHGGGWREGDLSIYSSTTYHLVNTWAADGWVVVNMNYRLGALHGAVDDGKLMLEDVQLVLEKFKVKPYVDPENIFFYGSSSGGQLAGWAAARLGEEVKGGILLSPTSNIAGAIAAGLRVGVPDAVVKLGHSAAEFFNYDILTDPIYSVESAQNFYIATSKGEWVDPRIHGELLARALGSKCTYRSVTGDAHGLGILTNHPEIGVESMAWANRIVQMSND